MSGIYNCAAKFINDIQDPIDETIALGKHSAHLAFRSLRYLWIPLVVFIAYDGKKNPDPVMMNLVRQQQQM